MGPQPECEQDDRGIRIASLRLKAEVEMGI
jgi:hypothetical protein